MNYTQIILVASMMLSSCFSWAMFSKVTARTVQQLMPQVPALAHLPSTQHEQIASLERELIEKKAQLLYTQKHFDWRLLLQGGALSGGLSSCTAFVAFCNVYHPITGPRSEALILLGAVGAANVVFYKALKEAAIENMQSDITQLSAQLQALQKEAREHSVAGK